jgi:hypothetical protein
MAVRFLQEQPGLRLLREAYYMVGTNDSDPGGPIMETHESGKGDASKEFAFPKGVRGVAFSRDGPRAYQFDVTYKVFLSIGATQEGRNGARIG